MYYSMYYFYLLENYVRQLNIFRLFVHYINLLVDLITYLPQGKHFIIFIKKIYANTKWGVVLFRIAIVKLRFRYIDFDTAYCFVWDIVNDFIYIFCATILLCIKSVVYIYNRLLNPGYKLSILLSILFWLVIPTVFLLTVRCISVNYMYWVYLYTFCILLMVTTLAACTVSYFFIGYRSTINLYLSIYLLFLPVVVSVLVTSLFIDFSVDVILNVYSLFFKNKFNLVSFNVDNLSVIFSTSTFLIGFFTGSFQYIYMSDDPKKDRFFFFLNYFVFSMVLFVHSSNYIILLLGWELLGITSFFLIIHYDLRYLTIKAALKAFSFNRLSDVFFLLVIVVQFIKSGDFYLNDSVCSENLFLTNLSFASTLLLVFAAFIKSAQLFFFFWLPDSMEAPIPASALIHSATLVSAGVYLLMRIKYDILAYPLITKIVLYSSVITLFIFTPIIAFQTDLKRLLALSTIVNISFLYILLVLLNNKYVCIYFIIHGLFKSCSFLLLGFFIVLNKHSQDYRSFGKLVLNPTYVGFLFIISTLFLSGSNVVFVYNIKHLIDGRSYFMSDFGYLVDIILLYYSLFSAIYGIKILYSVCIRNISNTLSHPTNFIIKNYSFLYYINNVISAYLLFSVIFSFSIYIFIFKVNIIYTYDIDLLSSVIYNNLKPGYLLPTAAPFLYTVLNANRYLLLNTVITTFIFAYTLI